MAKKKKVKVEPLSEYESKLRWEHDEQGLEEYHRYIRQHRRAIRRAELEASERFLEEPEGGFYDD